MHARRQMLASLMDLSGQAAAPTRADLVANVLRQAMCLCDATAATAGITVGRQFERWTLEAGDVAPLPVDDTSAPGRFEHSLMHAGLPLAIADLAEAGGHAAGALRFPAVVAGPALSVPLRFREQRLGYLAVARTRSGLRFGHRDARALALLGGFTGAMLDNLRLSETLEKLAVTDDLTQVYNYRYLKTALRREVKRATRFKQPLSIIMLDVDNLKGYNDRNGHLRGSAVLKEIAQIFATQVRSWDCVAKYGGDEFTVILPQTERTGAAIAAERLRAAVAAHTFPLAPPGTITVSAGVASYPEDGDSATQLIAAADRALYTAKRNGRNRVEGIEPMAA